MPLPTYDELQLEDDFFAAAWWLYVAACGIGNPWGPGPWRVVDGRLTKLPHLGDAGRGVNRELPHLGSAGQGVKRELPHLGNAGQEALTSYLSALSGRLQRVRITCGDWQRVLTPSVVRATAGNSKIGILLDPPYAVGGHLYHEGADHTLSDDVRDWCLGADPALRIVLCGYGADHDQLLDHGWTKSEGRAGGGAGYSADEKAGRRERLWLSPACVPTQGSLFDGGAA